MRLRVLGGNALDQATHAVDRRIHLADITHFAVASLSGDSNRITRLRNVVSAFPITYAARLDAATKLHGISSSMRL